MAEIVETAEVVETPEAIIPDEPIVETPVEVPDAPETPVDTPETPSEEPEAPEVPEGEPETEVATEEAPVEAVTFDTSVEVSALKEETAKVLSEYDIPQPVQAVIDALTAKAEGANNEVLEAYSVYGGVEDVTTLLDRQSLLNTERVDESGTRRPNTDKFIEQIAQVSTEEKDVIGWLFHDASLQPSQKYPKYNRAQELLIDGLKAPTDTSTQQVLDRYRKIVQLMQSNEMPVYNVPAFIPPHLHAAYNSLPKESRDEIQGMSPEYDTETYDYKDERARKLDDLAWRQKGLDSDAKEQRQQDYNRAVNEQQFSQAVNAKQETFFDSFRETFLTKLSKEVTFSSNPEQQALLSAQQVTLLTQAFDDGTVGEFARAALKSANVPFDYTVAQSLLQSVENASLELVQADRQRDEHGQLLDKIAYNKAVKDFERITEKWMAFGDSVITPLARLVSTGTAEEVKKQVDKKKIAPKARAATVGVGTQSAALPKKNPYQYGSQDYYSYQADEIIRAQEAAKARMYGNGATI